REAVELAWEARDADLLASILVARSLPSVRGRQAIRSWIGATLGGRRNTRRYEMARHRRNWRQNRGAQVLARAADRARHAVLPGSLPDREPDPVNLAFIRRFLGLAASRGIPVYYLMVPTRPDLQAECERSGIDAKYAAFLRRLQGEFPGLAVVNARAV